MCKQINFKNKYHEWWIWRPCTPSANAYRKFMGNPHATPSLDDLRACKNLYKDKWVSLKEYNCRICLRQHLDNVMDGVCIDCERSTCIRCKKEKKWSDMRTPASRICKTCHSEQKEKSYSVKRLLLKTDERCKKRMLSAARSRANNYDREFNIDLTDCDIPKVCPVLGIPLFFGVNAPSGQSPSLDRIDSSKGYIKGNVKVISMRANNLKNNATLEEMEKITQYMRGHLRSATL